MKTRMCVCDFVWCAQACVWVAGEGGAIAFIISKRSILSGKFAYKKRVWLLKFKEKKKENNWIDLTAPFTVRETEALGKLKQRKGACPRSQES